MADSSFKPVRKLANQGETALHQNGSSAICGRLVIQVRLSFEVRPILVCREAVVNFYDRWILPPILDLVMRQNQLKKYRREVVGAASLERHGRWLGYTSARQARVQSLFDQYGSLTVFITRTFMSYLSSVASLLAGMSH